MATAAFGATSLDVGGGGSVALIAPKFSYLITIVMENHPINGTDGVINMTNAPYIASLAKNNSLAERYLDTSLGSSLTQYIGITSANPTIPSSSCNGSPIGCQLNYRNIADSIEAKRLSWKAYMENMTLACNPTNAGSYDVAHNPFVYYDDIYSNGTTAPSPRCMGHVLPAGDPIAGMDSAFLGDLNNLGTVPNFTWLSPNLCNNMHDDCTTNPLSPTTCKPQQGVDANCIRQGDAYLQGLVPRITNSAVWKTGKAALFIVWDEPTFPCLNAVSSNPAGGTSCEMAGIWVGPMVKPSYKSDTLFTHYSYLSTIEAVWGLPSLTSNDASTTTIAKPMTEFFH